MSLGSSGAGGFCETVGSGGGAGLGGLGLAGGLMSWGRLGGFGSDALEADTDDWCVDDWAGLFEANPEVALPSA